MKTARMLGVELMPWQRQVAKVGLEHVGGQFVYRDVAIGTPRQSGKSTLLLALILWRMLASPSTRVIYGAQTHVAARGKLFDVWWPKIHRSALGGLFTIRRTNGAEALLGKNGSILTLLSTEEAAAHGETLDLAILDECWSMDPIVEQAVRPAMATRRNGQLWMLSTAGTHKSVFWRSKVDAGRTQATLGLSEGLAYFEWSAGEDVEVTDPATWPKFMPALGLTIDAETVMADLQTMMGDLAKWRRAYANQWPDESPGGWDVIDEDVWSAAES